MAAFLGRGGGIEEVVIRKGGRAVSRCESTYFICQLVDFVKLPFGDFGYCTGERSRSQGTRDYNDPPRRDSQGLPLISNVPV